MRVVCKQYFTNSPIGLSFINVNHEFGDGKDREQPKEDQPKKENEQVQSNNFT